ncbi:MAG: peptidoglycan DD-metalloendopeptidase family protein [Dinghuibacter sp.]|nr:peptidoglycan DD-metalloendopeptidase family protein [Dinghuibacter sp.]
MLKYTIYLLLFVLCLNPASAQQNNSKLQRQRDALQQQLAALNKQIAATDNQLSKTSKERAAIQQQIATTREQVALLDKKMAGIGNRLQHTQTELTHLHNRLYQLKRSYAASLALSWKLMNQPVAQQAFFSPGNVTEALQRAQYIKVLRRLQLQQVNEIRQLQTTYNRRKQELGLQQEQTGEQLQVQVQEGRQLSGKEQAIGNQVQQLQQQQNRLRLLARQTEKRKNAIEARMKKMLATVKPPVQNNGNNGKGRQGKAPLNNNTNTPPVVKSSNLFRANKYSLPCPVNGRIHMHFGYSVNNGIVNNNQFTTFRTAPNAPVYNVFEGEVHSVSLVEDTYLVLVRHGDVYTVYGNLASVQVQKGQTVNSGATIGRTARGLDTEEGELEFGVYEGKRLVNPEQYISCR